MSANQSNPGQDFSDDPLENLKIENEILKIKMQAESGARFEANSEVPPEIENQFLLQVQQFEEAWQKTTYVKLYDLLGRPDYKKTEEIPADEMEEELKKLEKLMETKNICLGCMGKYEPSVIYKFITEELFQQETENIQIDGWIKHFIYEEFHPNHQLDIENATQVFLDCWRQRSFGNSSGYLDKYMVLPEGSTMERKELIEKAVNFFNCFRSFESFSFTLAEIKFQFDEEGRGIGHAEGLVSYRAALENNEFLDLKGPFKLYLSCSEGWWCIFYFVMPGFKW